MIKKTSVILLTVLVILGLGFSGCDNGNTVKTYTVTFDPDGGTPATSTVEADEDSTITLPADPTKPGYTFGGWYTAKNGGGTEFTASTVVTGNIIVYAKWIDQTGTDYVVSLTGKTVKNADAWTSNYQGFVISLDLPDTFAFDSYTKLTVEGTCYDSDNHVIDPDWGQGQIKLLVDAEGSWDGDNVILTQYNLGMQTSDMTITLDSIPGGLVVQNSSADVAYIEITLIKFHN